MMKFFLVQVAVLLLFGACETESEMLVVAPNDPKVISKRDKQEFAAGQSVGGSSPSEILQLSMTAYSETKFLRGLGEITKKYSNSYEDSEKTTKFRYYFKNIDGVALELEVLNPASFVQYISDSSNYAVYDSGKRLNFENSDQGISSLQKETGGEFVIGQILLQDEADFFLSSKMGLYREVDAIESDQDCYVIRLSPNDSGLHSGMNRKIWISKTSLLILRYDLTSCTSDSCIFLSEKYVNETF